MSSQTISKYEVPLWRVLFVYAVIIAVLSLVLYRLFVLQVIG